MFIVSLVITMQSYVRPHGRSLFPGWGVGLFTRNFHTSLKITTLTALGTDTRRQLHLTEHKSNSLCTQFSPAAESISVCQDFIPKSIHTRLFPSTSQLCLSQESPPFQELNPAEKDALLIQSNSLYLYTTESN